MGAREKIWGTEVEFEEDLNERYDIGLAFSSEKAFFMGSIGAYKEAAGTCMLLFSQITTTNYNIPTT